MHCVPLRNDLPVSLINDLWKSKCQLDFSARNICSGKRDMQAKLMILQNINRCMYSKIFDKHAKSQTVTMV